VATDNSKSGFESEIAPDSEGHTLDHHGLGRPVVNTILLYFATEFNKVPDV
jgi:hypothetical protein